MRCPHFLGAQYQVGDAIMSQCVRCHEHVFVREVSKPVTAAELDNAVQRAFCEHSFALTDEGPMVCRKCGAAR